MQYVGFLDHGVEPFRHRLGYVAPPLLFLRQIYPFGGHLSAACDHDYDHDHWYGIWNGKQKPRGNIRCNGNGNGNGNENGNGDECVTGCLG